GPKCNRFCLNRSGDVSSFSRSSMCTRSGAVKVVPPETLRNVSASRASSVGGTLPYLTAGLRYRFLTILSCIAAARRDSLANRRIATVHTARARECLHKSCSGEGEYLTNWSAQATGPVLSPEK